VELREIQERGVKGHDRTFVMVDPDHVGTVQGESITTPDVLRVQTLKPHVSHKSTSRVIWDRKIP
jgi:hypothetical protein